jgi:hypothetical protein
MARSDVKIALLGGQPVGAVEQLRYPVFSAHACRRFAQLLEDGKVLSFNRSLPEVCEAEGGLWRMPNRKMEETSLSPRFAYTKHAYNQPPVVATIRQRHLR